MLDISFLNKIQYLRNFLDFILFYWVKPSPINLGLGRTRSGQEQWRRKNTAEEEEGKRKEQWRQEQDFFRSEEWRPLGLF
jgi:hypothetical protein